jgi:hypothetical protein
MRIAIIVAGLALSLTAVTAASSATQTLAGRGITPSDSTSKQAGVVMAAVSDAMVHHPNYHHYKHHYRHHEKAGHGKT